MTSLLAIPCCVMNLASRSDAEDSNTLEITGFGALIWVDLGALPASTRRIVSQGHDKVFTLKMTRKAFSGRRFAFD